MKKGRSIIKLPALSSVEAILAIALFSAMTLGISGSISYGLQATTFAHTHNQATLLANEGIEAVTNMRDANYSNLFAGNYGLSLTNNQWSLVPAAENIAGFLRTVNIADISTNIKKVTVTVSWNDPKPAGSVILEKQLTNWHRVINLVANWGLPLQKSTINLASGNDALKIKFAGNYAYLIRNAAVQNFVVVDISNPALPTLVTTLSLSGNPTDLAISGNFAYLSSSDNSSELQIINISNPAAPFLTGSYNAPANTDANGVYAVGTTVYLLRPQSSNNELSIIDAANPANTRLIGSLNLAGTANDIYVSGNFAYLASSEDNAELKIINIANPASPTIIGNYNAAGIQDALSILVSGTSVYLGRSNGEFSIINISTPSAPVLVSTFAAGTSAINDIAMGKDNKFVFLATSFASNELQLIDISNETSPILKGSFNSDSDLNGIIYDAVSDIALAVSSSNSQEFIIYGPTP